ncbi:MAG: hypothetical protein ABEI13_03915 [Candidatus Paceibacteria bacterium]
MADLIIEQRVEPKVIAELEEHYSVIEDNCHVTLDVPTGSEPYLRLYCLKEDYEHFK